LTSARATRYSGPRHTSTRITPAGTVNSAFPAEWKHVLKRTFRPVEGFIGVPPRIVGRVATAVRAGHGDPGRDSSAGVIDDFEPQRSHGAEIPALTRDNRLLLA
jgi:hypothetical protein